MLIYHAWMICSLSGLSHALSWSLLKQKQTYVSSQYKPAAVQEERDSFLPSHDGALIAQAMKLYVHELLLHAQAPMRWPWRNRMQSYGIPVHMCAGHYVDYKLTAARPPLAVALESSSRRSDCSGRAIAFINTRCGEVEMDEDERVRGEQTLPTPAFET